LDLLNGMKAIAKGMILEVVVRLVFQIDALKRSLTKRAAISALIHQFTARVSVMWAPEIC